MATGHDVQQIPETSAILLPPQRPEQPTLPPIERRFVAEHQAATTVSFAGAEPTETDRPEPAAAFAEGPAADKPIAVEAGPAAEEIPLEDIITNFLPSQQEEIRKHLDDKSIQQVLSEVRNFLTLLRESGIKLSPGRGKIPTPSLFGRLGHLTLTKDAALVREFFEKATIFFSAVNTAQTKNTSCLSTMLDSNTHITKFVSETADNLQLLAGNPYLKQITSMCSRKGVPDPVKVAQIIKWDCWKIDGIFSIELFRTFSSMMSGRGLISDQAQVVEILAWECWQPDGEFSMELLRTVSSMMSCRGFPDKEKLTAMLAWDCWKIDGKFRIDLLRIFSSMMGGCGFPEKKKVEAILAWPCWQVDGKFSFHLLRTFSSMSHSRGLIKQAEVERVLAWPCWQVDGKFSFHLLRTFSSMFHGRGLIKQAEVERVLAWPCWQVDGKFSFDLLRTFSSMSHSRGLIKQAEVERVLAWPCWQIDGKFNLRLLRVFSSMMNEHGIPKQADVEALLAWPCLQVDGKVSIDRLHILAAMMHGRGMPDQKTAEAFLAWLPTSTATSDKGQMYLRSAYRAFASTGVPDSKVLAYIEAPLRAYFTEDIADDEQHSSDSEEERSEMGQLKALTLFCAASAKWQRNLGEIQKFLAAYNTTSHSQTVVHAIMDSLLQILANHGQAGVRLWLEHHSRQPDSKGRLSAALSISAPLALAKFALKQLPESEWQDYITLCKNFIPTPDKEQWQTSKPLRDLLNKRFSLTLRKRTMLEILWSHSDSNRPRYQEKINALLKIVPATAHLTRLQQAFGQKKMQAFLDACLTWQNTVQQSANSAVVPELKIQELLLEGLLVANHYLSDHGPIPRFCFSRQTAGSDGQSVIVDGDVNMTGLQRLWHFVAAMLIELEQTEYQFKRQQIKISPPDSDSVVLPKPKFACRYGSSFVITNWSPEQLATFFRATEFAEHWYKPPQDKGVLRSGRLEEIVRQIHTRATQMPQLGPKRASLLSPTVIAIIIRYGDRLKEVVWSSLEHYAKNGQLGDELCRMLAPVIQQEPPGTVPEIVRTMVTARVGQVDMSNVPIVEIPSSSSASPLVTTSAAASAIQRAHATFEIAIQELERFHVLERDELEMLAPWRDRMTYTQLKNVIDKMNLDTVDLETELAWRIAFESKAREHLDLSLDELLEPLLEGADD